MFAVHIPRSLCACGAFFGPVPSTVDITGTDLSEEWLYGDGYGSMPPDMAQWVPDRHARSYHMAIWRTDRRALRRWKQPPRSILEA